MSVCVDACFLIALNDSGDGHHGTATELFEEFFDATEHQLVVPCDTHGPTQSLHETAGA
jgi:predicted nucleic acid-binding protein